jgi:hypothetical protein
MSDNSRLRPSPSGGRPIFAHGRFPVPSQGAEDGTGEPRQTIVPENPKSTPPEIASL